MKKSLFTLFIVALLSISATKPTTQNHPEGFHFFYAIHLDDEAIMTKSRLVIQPLMFAKDHDYDLVLTNTSAKVLVTIKDDRGVSIASNYDEKTDTYYTSLVFQSHITEFYSIEIKSNDPQDKGVCKIYSKCHQDKPDTCEK